MHFAAVTLLAAASLVVAQSSAPVVVHVGGSPSDDGGALQFTPPSVTAPKGTTIVFEFSGAPGNHSVTQSTFAAPCTRASNGLDSGFVGVPQGTPATSAPTWNLTILDDSKPLWFYCKQAKHCIAGMVFAVNAPTSGNTYELFHSAAKNVTTDPDTSAGILSNTQASAAGPPGPLAGGASPTGTPSGANVTDAPSPSGTSGANMVGASLIVTILSGLLGIALA